MRTAIGIRLWLRDRPANGSASDPEDAIIAIPTLAPTLGRVRQTYAGTDSFPPIARSYTQVSEVVRETGLLRRTPVFYGVVGLALLVGVAGCVAGFVLLGPSWFQLLIAAALGILLTQVAFLAHEAARAHTSLPVEERLCTVPLARQLGIPSRNLRLGTLAEHWGIPVTQAHRAADDVHVLVDVLRQCLDEAGRQRSPLPLEQCLPAARWWRLAGVAHRWKRRARGARRATTRALRRR